MLYPNNTLPESFLESSSNIYLPNYSKKFQLESYLTPLLIPFSLAVVHSAKTPLKLGYSDNNIISLDDCMDKEMNNRQINKIYLSQDQRKLYSMTITGEIFQW